MEERGFEQHLQNKIRKFLTYVWKYENQEKLETQALLQMIPNSFQDEVLTALNGKIVRESTIFKQNFSNKLITKLSLLAKEMTYPPDFIIYEVIKILGIFIPIFLYFFLKEQSVELNPNVYMLSKGILEFYLGSKDTIIYLDRKWVSLFEIYFTP